MMCTAGGINKHIISTVTTNINIFDILPKLYIYIHITSVACFIIMNLHDI